MESGDHVMAALDLRVLIITKGVNSVVKALTASQHNIIGIAEGFHGNKKQTAWQQFCLTLILLREKFRSPAKSLRKFASENKIPYLCMDRSNALSTKDWISALQPDLIVVFWLPRILKEDIFHIPPLGTINLHPSLLPYYRGPNPFFWAYYDYNLNPGATVHYIDKGQDTGDIILQNSVPILPGTPLPETSSLVLDQMGVDLLLQGINLIATDAAPRRPQPSISPTPKARHVSLKEYPAIIDWESWQTKRVWHFLRGTDYWLHKSRLWTADHPGVKWAIKEFELAPTEKWSSGCLYRENDCYFVACSDGIIYLEPAFSLKHYIRDHFLRLRNKFLK